MTATPAPLARRDLADLRWPRRFAEAVLARGTLPFALGAVGIAMAFSTAARRSGSAANAAASRQALPHFLMNKRRCRTLTLVP